MAILTIRWDNQRQVIYHPDGLRLFHIDKRTETLVPLGHDNRLLKRRVLRSVLALVAAGSLAGAVLIYDPDNNRSSTSTTTVALPDD